MRVAKTIPIAEAAKRLGVTAERVRMLCVEKRIQGARLTASGWRVPARFKVKAALAGRPPDDEREASRRRLRFVFQEVMRGIREADDRDSAVDAIHEHLAEIERLIVEVEEPMANDAWEIMRLLTNKPERKVIDPVKRTARGAYIRKANGRVYEYEAAWASGERAAWNARIWRDGKPRGTVGGAIVANTLDGAELAGVVVGLAERTIESGAGFQV